MKKTSVLVVEDNVLVGTSVKEILEKEGYHVAHVTNGKEAEQSLQSSPFSVVLLDLMLPDAHGRDLLEKWCEAYPEMLVIIMSAHGDIAQAVECIKLGAHDFLPKPVEQILLKQTIRNAVDQYQLSRQVTVLTELKQRGDAKDGLGNIVGSHSALAQAVALARRVAESDYSCLFIRGESGTGKGMFAKSIHRIGRRADKPFVDVNCSALPATLIESELFGHRKGAFTDAKEDRAGLFELADGGTLFLDEIGDMDASLQSKLLKVIEDQEFRRLGDSKLRQVDVCIIAATHQCVEDLIATGTFREDLYYRLNVIPLQLPPLRDHKSDIALLCEHFIQDFALKFRCPARRFSEEAMRRFMEYDWPGNIRELRNIVERGCLLAQDEVITDELLLLPPNGTSRVRKPSRLGLVTAPAMTLAEAERQTILRAMQEAEQNKNEAARILGVHRTTLYKKLAEYDIQ